MKWEDDYKVLVGKELKEGGRGLFQGVVP